MKQICGLATLLSLLALVPDVVRAEPDIADVTFTGHWQLNEAESEDPREKMRESMGQRGGLGGRFSGGGRGGAAGGRGTGSREDSRERMAEREASLEFLIIEHEEPQLRITFADERQLLIYTDGRKTDGDFGTTEAHWKTEGPLVVKTRFERGKRTETWKLSPDGSQLIITTEIPGHGPMPSISFDRVYDAFEPEAAEAG